MIQSVLRVQDIDHSLFYRLHDNDSSIEVCLLVCIPYDPVDKGSQEVAFSKLNHLFRITDGLSRIPVQYFHSDILKIGSIVMTQIYKIHISIERKSVHLSSNDNFSLIFASDNKKSHQYGFNIKDVHPRRLHAHK